MREIKFKAFDKKNNKIVENPSVYDYSSDEGYWFNLNIGLEDDDFIFLQYTGMKDKNKIEIYEDDWIKFRDRIYRIKWDRYRWQFFNKKGGMPISQIYNHLDEVEIIGNTYTNPELIKNHE